MDALLDQLATSVTKARTLEDLSRPLLSMLQLVSGLDSAYLTTIDLEKDEQKILFSHNAHDMQIPEGLAVPWGDTLCKRALEEGKPFTSNVSDCWGYSSAAKALGIETYVSTPIRLGDGALYGTLCAASSRSQVPSEDVRKLLALFATLIAQNIERERLLKELVASNHALAQQARTDVLTGLYNRRGLLEELARVLKHAKRSDTYTFVAFADLDGLKEVNDVHGHEVGDALLARVGASLKDSLRGEDLAARIGGDEFVVVGHGPKDYSTAEGASAVFRDRVSAATRVRVEVESTVLDYRGASVGLAIIAPGSSTPEEALDVADDAMYVVKRSRKERA
ncbi:sensor domain-containing diguanylate cyclase [Hydrogenophaga aquatica]